MKTLTDAFRQAIEHRLSDVHTCLPAQIISYDHTKEKASVEPLLKRKYRDGKIDRLPIIVNVPVVWPRSGGCSLTFPVKKGDGCLLIFSERSLDKWLSVGGVVEPDDPRKFDLTDAIALMGLTSFAEESDIPNNENLLLRYQGTQLVMDPSGGIRLQNDAGATLKLDGAGKCALGANGVELLDVLVRTLDFLSKDTVDGKPLAQQGNYGSLKGELESILGSL